MMTEQQERIRKANDKISELKAVLEKKEECSKIANKKVGSDKKAYKELLSNPVLSPNYDIYYCRLENDDNEKMLELSKELAQLAITAEAYSKSLEEARKIDYDIMEIKIRITTLQDLIVKLKNARRTLSEIEEKMDKML